MSEPILFHLAFPVDDLAAARRFYVEGLGCEAGRESEHSLILNLKGNQIVAQLSERETPQAGIYPRHFGLIFHSKTDWEAILNHARAQQLKFYQEPKLRFPDTPIAHHTFFLEDPAGNRLEFKHYLDPKAIFGGTRFTSVGDR